MLVVGEAPFHEANDSETLTMILDCKYHIPPGVSEECNRWEFYLNICFEILNG